jgi:uncharacterized membrane protein
VPVLLPLPWLHPPVLVVEDVELVVEELLDDLALLALLVTTFTSDRLGCIFSLVQEVNTIKEKITKRAVRNKRFFMIKN